MITTIYYEIEAKKDYNGEEKTEAIDFKKVYDTTYGEVDAYSRNPVRGWTRYTGFTDGWTEIDPDSNDLLSAIKYYATSYDLYSYIEDADETDIGKTMVIRYVCEHDQYNPSQEYTFEVTIIDIIEEDE